MARRGGLGKGLGALIPTATTEGSVGLREIPIASVKPNKYQPRTHFDEEDLAALVGSIREVGVLQPVLVRPEGDGYELIAGERRWRAAKRVGLQTIPALVHEADDAAALEQALVENVHRSDLNPLEEAAAYQQLIEDFGLTHEEVASRVGKGRATISNTLRLMHLPPTVQRALRDGQLSMGHARALLGTPDRIFQEKLAREVVAEGLSVRAVEDAVRAHGMSDDNAGTDPGAPAKQLRVPRLRAPGLLELEELLSERLATGVHVSMGARRGRVVVDFSGLDDLERIYKIIAGAEQTVGSE